MEIIYVTITGLSIVSTILAWLSKIRWAKEYTIAKDEIIKSKNAEILVVKEQLAGKDLQIKEKESQIQHLNSLNPPKLKEFYETIKSGLEAYNDKLQEELKTRNIELENTIVKLNNLEPESENSKMLIATLNSEKEALKLTIETMTKQVESQQETIKETNRLSSTSFSFGDVGLRRNESDNQQIIDDLKELKAKTNFLWKGLIELGANENSLKEEIKQKTYQQVKDILISLQFVGVLDFKISDVYETSTNKEKVYELSAWNISTKVKNFSKLIENGQV